jgi:hypothetical protein
MSPLHRRILAGCLLAVAGGCVVAELLPTPQAAPEGPLVLRGEFVGPTAAEDAAALAGLARGVSEALRHDAERKDPRIATGVHLEDLRVAACEGRLLPRSFSRQQPAVAAECGKFLDNAIGTSGGPLTADRRQAAIEAYAAIAAAAEAAIQ